MRSWFYFAYGSNMCLSQMKERCPDSEAVGVMELKNFEFVLDTRGFASIEVKLGKSVWGMVYYISAEDEAKLDAKEGVAKSIYRKTPLIGCFAYISNFPRGDNSKEGRPGYMAKIIEAAISHNFPENYILELKSWSAPA